MPKVVHIPQVQYQNSPHPVGNNGGAGSVSSWHVDALLGSHNNYHLPNGTWSGGGPFFCYKASCDGTGGTDSYTIGTTPFNFSYWGLTNAYVSPPPAQLLYPKDFVASETALLSGYAATGYKRTRPGNPIASLGQFVVELRDLPVLPLKKVFFSKKSSIFRGQVTQLKDIPRRLQQHLLDQKQLGSEYLNVQFGWMPFVRDLQGMYNLWKTLDKEFAKLHRENGKWVNRRARLLSQVTTDVLTPGANLMAPQKVLGAQAPVALLGSGDNTQAVYNYPWAYVRGASPNYTSGVSVHSLIKTTTDRVWYSTKSGYYVPDMGSSQWTARARAALFGALPTPELLWEVMPWSWLIDWFSNAGDVMSNLSYNAVDNYVCRYSYCMHHQVVEIRGSTFSRRTAGSGSFHIPVKEDTITTTSKIETKSRIGGTNPFGIGAQFSSLNTRQLGILAALGMSRGIIK